MLCLSSAAAGFRPADPAAQQQQHSLPPRATPAVQGMLSLSSAAAFSPADPAAHGAMASQQHFKGLAKPTFFDRWVNLRVPFEAAFGAGRRNLQEAVQEAGLQWDGRLHCGLDDARNTARLLAELMRRGVAISFTGSLAPPLQPKPEPQPQLQPQLVPANQNLSSCIGGAVAADCCCCYCGVAIRRGMMAMPGPMQGQCFYICGNWTPTLGPMCPFFIWVA
ncbi:hypothetical protein BAE44_0009307 [Dichanthelium oligosanthes]|uniref:GRF-type domain-containing protein n=1 Tax=Dichanthelium oligosanthes TaxID=888268 RepID=A0A1E5VX49_9POAL|nr:hypothetical protein BAE44_0009307 [Dichanthelium oligosanthes]